MDIINIIDRLEALVNTSTRVPATGRALVDARKVMELVDQLRLAIPQDVKAAQEILLKKENILNQAQIEARRTKTAAEEEFRARLDQSEVITEARRRAQELLDDSQQKASRMLEQAEKESKEKRAEADAYAFEALLSLERELNSVLTSVRKGLDVLGAGVRS